MLSPSTHICHTLPFPSALVPHPRRFTEFFCKGSPSFRLESLFFPSPPRGGLVSPTTLLPPCLLGARNPPKLILGLPGRVPRPTQRPHRNFWEGFRIPKKPKPGTLGVDRHTPQGGNLKKKVVQATTPPGDSLRKNGGRRPPHPRRGYAQKKHCGRSHHRLRGIPS